MSSEKGIASMDFFNAIQVASTGLKAQGGRMRVISENIANASSTAKVAGGDPYRRRIPTFKAQYDREIAAHGVQIGRINNDKSDFTLRLEPGHPAANEEGYVKYPNVNPLIEAMDMREAQRSYEANMNIISSSRQMLARTIDIMSA